MSLDKVFDRIEAQEELIELTPGETSLTFLQKVYRSVKQPMSRRLRAAIEAMPHEHPRLGVVAIGTMNGDDIASMLDRAIARSGKVIDVTPNGDSQHSNGRHTQVAQGSSLPDVVNSEAKVPAAPSPSEVSAQAQRQPFPRLRR